MQLTITGIGMMTSVGHDVETACASLRVGISRAGPLEHLLITDEDTHDAIPIVGCPITPITDGFGTVARWSIMAREAFINLLLYAKLPSAERRDFWQKTALIFATPSLKSPNLAFEGVVNSENVKTVYITPFLRQTGLPISENSCFVVDEDNTAVIKACDMVDQLLGQESIQRVVVISADTNIEANTLSYLNLHGRLKTPDNPVGLMPGEAAVALLFESELSIQQRGAKTLAQIYSHNVKQETNSILSNDPNTGTALAASIKETLKSVQPDTVFTGGIYSDLNGEQWRAQEYSSAKMNISRELLSEKTEEILPASSLGDIGVANAACCLCIFIESKKRGYGRGEDALILASGAMGATGSMLVKSC